MRKISILAPLPNALAFLSGEYFRYKSMRHIILLNSDWGVYQKTILQETYHNGKRVIESLSC
jgi:hypothetical protein